MTYNKTQYIVILLYNHFEAAKLLYVNSLHFIFIYTVPDHNNDSRHSHSRSSSPPWPVSFQCYCTFFNYLLEAHTHEEQVKPYHVVILVLQLQEFTNFQANASKIFRVMLLDMQVCEYIIIYKYIANNNIQRYGKT